MGGSVVVGIGIVEGVESMIIAHDPTVRGGASNPYTFRKVFRGMAVARENRLPIINVVESGGGGPAHAGRDLRARGASYSTTSPSTARRACRHWRWYSVTRRQAARTSPGMCDYVVMVRNRSKVFLGGPPLVKMATGEVSDDESLGGADMHARTSGLADYMAEDEQDAIRIGRRIMARLNWRKLGPGPTQPPTPPAARPPRPTPRDRFGGPEGSLRPRDVIARIVDGSAFDEFKPLYGTSLVTGWASIHGYPVGILANARGILFSEEAEKAAQFIQLANQIDTPLVFLQNTTGYMVGAEYEQGGIIKDGAKMINAVSNSAVPHLTIVMGASYGAGNYGMCGRSYSPRFLFTWPNSRSAVMGPAQLAGVLSIVARESAADRGGLPFDEEADAQMRAAVEGQIERESLALANSGRLYDDGIIDPRDTRTVLGFCLSVVHNSEIRGQRGYGVFRM